MENSVSVNETAVMNSIKNGMKNLLFIEGNRSEIDKANVVESYNKIKAMGFIPTMPVEFLPIEQAQNKLDSICKTLLCDNNYIVLLYINTINS